MGQKSTLRRSSASSMTTDAKKMDKTVIASMCPYGAGCREGHNCSRRHTDAHRQLFTEKKKCAKKSAWMARCGFCVAGCSWYGQSCLRSIRCRFSETAYRNPRDDLDSYYVQRNEARIAQTNVRQEKRRAQCMNVWKMHCLLVCADNRIF